MKTTTAKDIKKLIEQKLNTIKSYYISLKREYNFSDNGNLTDRHKCILNLAKEDCKHWEKVLEEFNNIANTK